MGNPLIENRVVRYQMVTHLKRGIYTRVEKIRENSVSPLEPAPAVNLKRLLKKFDGNFFDLQSTEPQSWTRPYEC
ncbi:Hypothetical predicted protein [Cloeon dipterum]|uniref:Uncharacterized protein n=1 Tax=Cloeon dipterum TaxID=197152 RepID=A0A8S1CYM2_9INSE|nr:Hypothetical predicted protein [Cloeon dipterum]